MSSQSHIIGEIIPFDRSWLIHHFLEKNASIYPFNAAVTDTQGTIHYQPLNEAANQLAYYLKEEGILLGDRIAVCITPSIHLIITVLAILKLGAVYIPLDISYPEKSGRFILDDANPKLILTNIVCPFLHHRILDISTLPTTNYPTDNLNSSFDSEAVAYILYTSGSTGTPKGVMIPHRSVVNHMLWMQQAFNFTHRDKILLKTALTFDPSVWEILLPIFTGAELVVAISGCLIDTQLLIEMILQYQITTVQFVPILLHKFLSHPKVAECTSLKRVFVGGESLSSTTKNMFFDKLSATLVNLYGPTETSINVISYLVSPKEELQKDYIGKPIYNTTLYILNKQGEVCEIDQPGELYIGGACLGLGYLNREELTQAHFIKNPFSSNQKMYKTGDFVCLRKNGLIEYLGRKDKQVKINGVRVELDAIISKILAEENVSNCTIIQSKIDAQLGYLIAYIVPKIGRKIDLSALKINLAQSLQKSLIPKVFHLIPALPLLANGKIDIQKLKQYAEKKDHNFIQEKKDIQIELLIFCRQLSHNEKLTVKDNLYYMGIDSLYSLLLIDHIKKSYFIDLMIHEVLSHTTVEALTRLIVEKLKSNTPSKQKNNTLIALKKVGNKIPLFLIHPIGGTVFWYNHIAHYFDPDRPLYGIQDPGIESDNYFFDNIQEMATFYFKNIQVIQPQGPYLIGGASFGATIAVEICRHLTVENVIAIPILDGWGIYPHELTDENYFRKSMIKQQQNWKEKFGVNDYQEHQKIFLTQRNRLELLYRYQMEPILHNILLFKSKEISELFKPINCDDNNWGKYAKGKLEVIVVPGDHETMFEMPHVKKLALNLSDSLNKITQAKN